VVGAYREDAPDFVFPEEPWGFDQVNFYVRKGTAWRYQGLDSLRGMTVGLIGGYAYEPEFNKLVSRKDSGTQFQIINENNALELNIRKLLMGRIAATLESVYVMNAKLKQLGLEDVIESAGVLTRGEPMYIACTPEKASSRQYVRWIDQGTRRLRNNGGLQKILARYGLEDWKAPD
ncbi:MAG: ABC transporter substrate-binding protein, partial [Ketobacteraceae bacterium]|nr:ABC transporter substrate-binding protein [Ketobacteraceae bacterium]